MTDPWRHWRRLGAWAILGLPVTALYCVVVTLRRGLYRRCPALRRGAQRPVIVVGNITVGGTGKTPFAAWLCRELRALGWRPGLVLRGYGGRHRGPLAVGPESDTCIVGDEAVLLARRTGAPVVIGRDRVRAARALPADCDVIIADDGLQHYRLDRRIEIGVLDGNRRFGNGLCLPSGPLREPLGRWRTLDFRVTQGAPAAGEWGMRLEGDKALALVSGACVPAASLKRVHAVAGIGHPERFFHALRDLGLEVVAHAFADHHNYVPEDLAFADAIPILMTEKDAVKCEGFADARFWYLPVTAAVDPDLARRIASRLATKES